MKITTATLIGLCFAVGCGPAGSARIVDANTQGGEVVLEGPYMDRVADALVKMAIHCDGEFAILDDTGEALYVDAPSREQTRAEFVCTGHARATR